MSPTRAMMAEAICRANWRDDMRLAALLFAGAVVFFIVLGVA